jgi:hypothetical protein
VAEGASIGSVYVDVLPSSEGFFAKFQAQTQAQATKVGQELGGQIGKQISDSIVKGIREGLGKGTEGSPGKAPGKKSGEDFAGEFERTVQTRIAAALRALPKAQIGADATDAEKKVQELRASLAELASKRIGIDISDEQAIAEVRRLQEELARLARESPSVRVTADAARAAAELEAVRREAERLAGLNPNIRIDTNAGQAAAELLTVDQAASTSSGGMRTLYAAGIALGPGIIPVAAACAAAVAGIGAGALGAAAGLGVVILGTRGIGDAVKAMGAADQSAAKDAVQLASRQSQLASASDSVASAQRGLANAQANAADASRRAAETVRNAQTSLAQAEQQALRAEQDLTRAREDARRAMEDLATQVADGALSQRQAQLDLTKAEQELQAVRSNPAASQLQREQAQLTYDQARQQITDLGIRQSRAQQDLAASQKAGINGSQQVVAAQDRVAQSQEAVRKAVQSLADARIAEATTARQNAFAIASAAQSVASAQRSLQQATVAAGTAGGAAMDTLKQKMDALSPAGQAFAAFLYSLKPVWLDLTSSAQGGFLPGAQAGIEALLPVMPQIIGDVGMLSRTVGDLSAEAGRTFAAPYWQSFFHFLSGEANVALVTFAHASENAAVGAAGLVRAVLPIGQDFGQGLLHFTEEFARWGAQAGQNAAFQQVLAYIRTEGPIVIDDLGQVAAAVARIATAAEPVGGFVLTTIRLLADTINAIPIPVLTVLVGTISGVVFAMKAWEVVQAAQRIGLPILTGLQLVYNAAVSGAGAAMSGASGSFGSFGTALAGVKGGAQGAAGALGQLGSGLGAGGLIGLGLAAAFIGFTAVSSAIQAQRQRTDDLTRAMRSLHDALNATGGANKDSVRSIVEGNEDLSRAVRLANEYGLSSDALVRALKGEKGAQQEVTAALDAKIKKDEQQFSNFSLSDAGLKQLNRERELRDALKKTYEQLGDNATLEDILAGQEDKAAQSGFHQTEAQQALGKALNIVADASSTAAQKADALKQADDALFGAARSADQAAEDFAAAQDRLNSSVAHGTHELGLNTAGARDNYDALKTALKAADDEYFANIRNGMSVADATKKHNAQTEALKAQAAGLKLDAGQVQHLIDTYGRVPTDVKTQVTVAGVQEALNQLQTLEIAQIALRQGVDPQTATRIWREQNPTAGRSDTRAGHATGGPVFGAGTETSDSIPAWLSNNEHVWTAAEVKAAGGHAVVEMLRAAVLGGALRPPKARYPGDGSGGIAFAQGGAVTWPFPVSLAGLWKPSPAELRAAVLYGPAFTGPISGNIAGIQSWIRAQAGKPYIWASAGPSGYDCSGATSAVWNLIHGRGAYSHTFSTMNEAPFFPLPGFGGVYSAGWTNPGERGPGGNSVGHTAGVFAGLPFESRGGDGFVVGSRVTPISSFAHVGHFDQGGVLPPGITIARNDTGRNEFVLREDQLARIGSDGPSVAIHVHPPDGASPREIAAMVRHELAWELDH